MIVPLLAGLALLQVAPAADYVPDTGWRDSDFARPFYERWFGNQLRAMQEPPLTGDADRAGYRERFRLLVLPTFSPAYAWRIDVRRDGSANLHWALLNGRGGYAPGALARQGSRPLRAAELRSWRDAAAVLATLPREMQPATDPVNGPAICVDGTTIVFEQLGPRRRDYVVRDCDFEPSLRDLIGVVSRMKPRNRMD